MILQKQYVDGYVFKASTSFAYNNMKDISTSNSALLENQHLALRHCYCLNILEFKKKGKLCLTSQRNEGTREQDPEIPTVL